MNVLNKLSIKNLKLNKKRTISTIIGIILSVALICAVSSMGTSFQASLVQNAVNEYGYYHLKIEKVTKNDIETFSKNRDIKDIFELGRVGDAKAEGVVEPKRNGTTFYRIFSSSRESFDKLKLVLKEGEFPKNENEIIINQTLNSRLGLDIKIGDTITLNIGEIDYELDDIVNANKKSFKVVGIMKRPNTCFEGYNDPYTLITNKIETEKNDVYISLKNPKEYETAFTEILGGRSYHEVESDPINLKYNNFKENTELLRWEIFAFSDSTVDMLFAVITVVIFIIIFTSVFCIKNSFAIATTEKLKMYGMLASVGATKKQIKQNVISECMMLGIIGIPLGIASGIFAVFVLLKIVNALIGDNLLAYLDGLIFKISLLPILVSVILGVVTIYLSAISSAKRASKVSPIDNLRGSKEIKLNNKALKTPKIISKLFKTGGVLAFKNLKRNKRKYRTTVASISVSIFIFITLNAFIVNTFDLRDNYYTSYDYNLNIQHLEDIDDIEPLINQILSLDNIENSFEVYASRTPIKITDESKINNEDNNGFTYDMIYDEEKDENIEVGEHYAPLDIVALDDNSFKQYVKKIGGNYNNLKQTGILCDKYNYYNDELQKRKEIRRYLYDENDFIEGKYEDKDIKIKVGKITDIKPYLYEGHINPIGIIVLNNKYFSEMNLDFRGLAIQSNKATELENNIKKINEKIYISNLEETARRDNGMVLVFSIFLYGFISVITLIGITNIFNTITSNMELRQKEFAMLKSIGMTKNEFNNMINLETLFYGVKAWIYGTILGLLGTFALYRAFQVKMDKGMYIPVKPIFVSAIFVFLFIFIIMRYSISKINKQNTIETIRNENI